MIKYKKDSIVKQTGFKLLDLLNRLDKDEVLYFPEQDLTFIPVSMVSIVDEGLMVTNEIYPSFVRIGDTGRIDVLDTEVIEEQTPAPNHIYQENDFVILNKQHMTLVFDKELK